MPEGHIRGFQSNTADLRGISEWQIYPPPILSLRQSPLHTAQNCLSQKKGFSKVFCVASRGRGLGWVQRFEARADGLTNTITSVGKDNFLLQICKKNTS